MSMGPHTLQAKETFLKEPPQAVPLRAHLLMHPSLAHQRRRSKAAFLSNRCRAKPCDSLTRQVWPPRCWQHALRCVETIRSTEAFSHARSDER